MSNLHIVLRPLFNLTTICSSLLIERIDRLRTTRAFSSTLYYHSVNSGKYLYMYSYIAFFHFFFSPQLPFHSVHSIPLPHQCLYLLLLPLKRSLSRQPWSSSLSQPLNNPRSSPMASFRIRLCPI